jgi:uncharacterized protein Gcw-chp
MRFKIRALTALFVLLSAASVSITQAQTPAPADAKPTEPYTITGDFLNYTDWKLTVTWLVAGYNVGAYYSDSNAKDSGYTIAGRNIGKSTGTVFIQKTF